MASASPVETVENIQWIENTMEAKYLQNGINSINAEATSEAAMIGHTLCACQKANNDLLNELATMQACSDLQGQMGVYRWS